LDFAVRILAPVIQQANESIWDLHRSRYILADTVLPDSSILPKAYPYWPEPSSAFGPGTLADLSCWSGLNDFRLGGSRDLAVVGSGPGSRTALYSDPEARR
jgi:hypothetical protein